MEEILDSSDPQSSDEAIGEAEHQSVSESKNPFNADSEFDSGDKAQETLQVETLETELSNNPTNYDAHVQVFIRSPSLKVHKSSLRKKGDIEKLRQAREAMSELFPLSPTMWQEGAKYETSLSSGPLYFLELRSFMS